MPEAMKTPQPTLTVADVSKILTAMPLQSKALRLYLEPQYTFPTRANSILDKPHPRLDRPPEPERSSILAQLFPLPNLPPSPFHFRNPQPHLL